MKNLGLIGVILVVLIFLVVAPVQGVIVEQPMMDGLYVISFDLTDSLLAINSSASSLASYWAGNCYIGTVYIVTKSNTNFEVAEIEVMHSYNIQSSYEGSDANLKDEGYTTTKTSSRMIDADPEATVLIAETAGHPEDTLYEFTYRVDKNTIVNFKGKLKNTGKQGFDALMNSIHLSVPAL